MKTQYFPETDTLAIELTSKTVASTDSITDDLILDYDAQSKVVAITVDNCSKNVDAVNLQTLDVPLLDDRTQRDQAFTQKPTDRT